MGVCVSLRTLSDATIDRLIADPRLARVVLMDDEDEIEEVLGELQPAAFSRKGGWLTRLLGGPAASAPAGPLPTDAHQIGRGENEGICGDVDKAWDAINFLLTHARGDRWPAHFLVEG